MDSTTDAQLPTMLPVLPGLVLAGQYGLTECQPTHRGDTLGACVLPGGRVALMVADVVGHGLGASLAAAQVRAILWSHLGDGATLETAVERLDRYAERHSELCAATVGVAVLAVDDGTLEYTAAGLLPPLVLTPHHPPRLLGAAPMRPLGMGGRTHVQQTVLRADDMVVMTTNGLVSTPAAALRQATDDLMLLAAHVLDESADRDSTPAQRADDVGHDLLSQHFMSGRSCDDVALLVAQRMRVRPKFSVTLSAETLDVSELRGLLSGWLEAFGAGLVDHISLGHAVVELATNVAKHAYQGDDEGMQPMRIDAAFDETGVVTATVTDHGRWRTPEDPGGRGLAMAGGLMDSIRVRRSPDGTQVEVRTRLGRPAQLWEADSGVAKSSIGSFPDELSAIAVSGRLTASGPVDEGSADLFHAALIEATHAGTTAATVDLSEVTHLSSPGVQSLFDFLKRSDRSGVSLSIVAPRSTPARQILDLVGLPAGP